MKKRIALFLAVLMLMAAGPACVCYAETSEEAGTEAAESADDVSMTQASVTEDTAEEVSSPQDNIVTTKHTAVIQGKQISYTAETGTVFLETGGYKPKVVRTLI